jgi:hypothetical protein
VPRLDRLPQLQCDPVEGHRAVTGESELDERRKPLLLERIAFGPQLAYDIGDVLRHEMRQHPAVVQLCAPRNQPARRGLLPEARDESARQRLHEFICQCGISEPGNSDRVSRSDRRANTLEGTDAYCRQIGDRRKSRSTTAGSLRRPRLLLELLERDPSS